MAFSFLSRCSLIYQQCVVNFGQELDHAKFAFVLNCKRVNVSDVLEAVGQIQVVPDCHRPEGDVQLDSYSVWSSAFAVGRRRKVQTHCEWLLSRNVEAYSGIRGSIGI